MKKILIALLAVLMLTACSTNKTEKQPEVVEPVVDEKTEENENVVVGGWTLNTDLPEMNDADFSKAREELVGVNYSPLFILGTQGSANNTKYLCYATAVVPNAKPELKVVTIHKDYDDSKKCEIEDVEDFNILNYLQGEGANTPEGLMGGWQDNYEQPNMLSDEEKEVFEKAVDGLLGVKYTPVATIATQVVAGINYAFLATGTATTETPITHLYIVKVYADLQGNAEITNICGVDLSEILK